MGRSTSMCSRSPFVIQEAHRHRQHRRTGAHSTPQGRQQPPRSATTATEQAHCRCRKRTSERHRPTALRRPPPPERRRVPRAPPTRWRPLWPQQPRLALAATGHMWRRPQHVKCSLQQRRQTPQLPRLDESHEASCESWFRMIACQCCLRSLGCRGQGKHHRRGAVYARVAPPSSASTMPAPPLHLGVEPLYRAATFWHRMVLLVRQSSLIQRPTRAKGVVASVGKAA
mmetsp:Transcript_65210/g.187512  ORF Transcript_65210/g.187512 Transcript_65210/m.187512 type:complete len:228 (-) Transcript_65210:296-979(-)